MANTDKTGVVGTIVEVSDDGGTTWEKFVCNEGALEVDYGTQDEQTYDCLETGEEKTVLGINRYTEQTFMYVWTQALTNAADTIVRAAKNATNQADKEIDVRLTMANKTGVETTGTIYVVPFIVKGYIHKGESGNKWTTETVWKQNGAPVETAAA